MFAILEKREGDDCEIIFTVIVARNRRGSFAVLTRQTSGY